MLDELNAPDLMDTIARAVLAGASLDEVEDELIDPLRASEDQKSALWLWAWGIQQRSYQRAEVRQIFDEISYASD